MPDPYWPKRKGAYTLSDAERAGSLARMWCRYCKVSRYYRPGDLRKLLGDIECDDVTDHHTWRCTSCGKSGTVEMKTGVLSAADRQSVVIRRLVRIDYIKRPVWKDERL